MCRERRERDWERENERERETEREERERKRDDEEIRAVLSDIATANVPHSNRIYSIRWLAQQFFTQPQRVLCA